MELLLNTLDKRHRIEVYNEYLKKIPELLKQLETVEKMYGKALLEDEMLREKDRENLSVSLYDERLNRIKQQCEIRSAPSIVENNADSLIAICIFFYSIPNFSQIFSPRKSSSPISSCASAIFSE